MTNYPPGVSGLEPQIIGYDERDSVEQVGECQNFDTLAVVITYQAWSARRSPATIERKWRRVSATAKLCTFDGGDVDGLLVWGDPSAPATFFWSCPSCGDHNDREIHQ